MPASMPNRSGSREIQSLDGIKGRAVRVTDPRPRQSSPSAQGPAESNRVDEVRLQRLGRVMKAALVTAHGSGQAAAIEIGVDQSQLNRQLSIGTFDGRGMSAAGDTFLALLGRALSEEFGPSQKSKRQLARELIPQFCQTLLDLTEEE